jgi:4a-hydroxytetrahydrobiopterin dehydratase
VWAFRPIELEDQMTPVQKLSEPELTSRTADLPRWSVVNGKFHRAFTFSDFIDAFAFMTGVALIAQSANHHPEWCNVYDRVTIDLVTHEAGGISIRDIELAKAIEQLSVREQN